MPGSWRFSSDHFAAAVKRWCSEELPTEQQVDAIYDWAMSVVVAGPPDSGVLVAGTEDRFVDLVGGADAFVSFLAVAQDQTIFVLSIVSA